MEAYIMHRYKRGVCVFVFMSMLQTQSIWTYLVKIFFWCFVVGAKFVKINGIDIDMSSSIEVLYEATNFGPIDTHPNLFTQHVSIRRSWTTSQFLSLSLAGWASLLHIPFWKVKLLFWSVFVFYVHFWFTASLAATHKWLPNDMCMVPEQSFHNITGECILTL